MKCTVSDLRSAQNNFKLVRDVSQFSERLTGMIFDIEHEKSSRWPKDCGIARKTEAA
jgi:hypothetical protein